MRRMEAVVWGMRRMEAVAWRMRWLEAVERVGLSYPASFRKIISKLSVTVQPVANSKNNTNPA